ncbi:hypothetical protein B0H66DRAFT_595238 [Apodospora peruviana]|uniref:Uncharacterized protein n=1 Tax=Apodospora peruviana TaxID=516989 RepID=A0AAE0HTM5_9PEZI|nr:hypothetical protein B0H66DRAFT_595238 [Apodospora peruviana]
MERARASSSGSRPLDSSHSPGRRVIVMMDNSTNLALVEDGPSDPRRARTEDSAVELRSTDPGTCSVPLSTAHGRPGTPESRCIDDRGKARGPQVRIVEAPIQERRGSAFPFSKLGSSGRRTTSRCVSLDQSAGQDADDDFCLAEWLRAFQLACAAEASTDAGRMAGGAIPYLKYGIRMMHAYKPISALYGIFHTVLVIPACRWVPDRYYSLVVGRVEPRVPRARFRLSKLRAAAVTRRSLWLSLPQSTTQSRGRTTLHNDRSPAKATHQRQPRSFAKSMYSICMMDSPLLLTPRPQVWRCEAGPDFGVWPFNHRLAYQIIALDISALRGQHSAHDSINILVVLHHIGWHGRNLLRYLLSAAAGTQYATFGYGLAVAARFCARFSRGTWSQPAGLLFPTGVWLPADLSQPSQGCFSSSPSSSAQVVTQKAFAHWYRTATYTPTSPRDISFGRHHAACLLEVLSQPCPALPCTALSETNLPDSRPYRAENVSSFQARLAACVSLNGRRRWDNKRCDRPACPPSRPTRTGVETDQAGPSPGQEQARQEVEWPSLTQPGRDHIAT